MEGNELCPYRPQVVITNRAGEAEIVTASTLSKTGDERNREKT